MAAPADQGMGSYGEYPSVQPSNGLRDPEGDIPFSTNADMMQLGNGLWNFEDSVNFSDISDNTYMMQAVVRSDGIPRTFSNHMNNLMANGLRDSRGHNSDYIPRGDVVREQILAAHAFQVADSNIKPQHLQDNNILAEEGLVEPEYVTHAGAQHVTKHTGKHPGPSLEEWTKWKPQIHGVYVDGRCTLEVTRAEMAKKGFYAKASMYKRKIKEWGWKTYGLDKDNGNSTGEPSIGQPVKRTRGKVSGPPSTLYEENSLSNSSPDTTVVGYTPTHVDHTNSNSTCSNSPHITHPYISPTNFGMGIPASMSKTGIDKLVGTILDHVGDLYVSYHAQAKWKATKQREVEEDIHDDLLVGVSTTLRSYRSLSPAVGDKGFQEALHTLEKVVGVREGADCGLFSLPAIWESFLRMIRNKRPDLAGKFLLKALQLALERFGYLHPFVQVLFTVLQVWREEPGQLEEVIFKAYRSCIAYVKEKFGAFNLTYLSLWGDYVVYLDGKSTNETQAVVDSIRSLIKIIEEEKGPDGGKDGDYTLELLGLTLYVFQSSPTMVEEAEKVAKDMLLRVNRRVAKAGGELEGNSFILRKDLSHTLGTFCQKKEDYHQAITYLKDFLNYEIVDGRDIIALEKLEECYFLVGREDEAKQVWKWRMDSSQRLLQKTNIEQAGDDEVANNHRERDDDKGKEMSEDEEEGSEATARDKVEEINKEILEEDDTDDDSDVEMQLVREQIAELNQRLNVLEQRKAEKKRL